MSEEGELPPTKRERERERYLKVNVATCGAEGATARWAAYEQLILGKYGDGDLEKAWKARDRAHALGIANRRGQLESLGEAWRTKRMIALCVLLLAGAAGSSLWGVDAQEAAKTTPEARPAPQVAAEENSLANAMKSMAASTRSLRSCIDAAVQAADTESDAIRLYDTMMKDKVARLEATNAALMDQVNAAAAKASLSGEGPAGSR